MKSRFSTYIAAVTLFTAVVAALPPIAQAGVKSEDGQGKIVFVQGVDNPAGTTVGDLFSINPDGSGLQQLTAFGSSGGAQTPGWSSDGQSIVFSFVPSASGQAQIWEMNSDGSNQHLLVNDPAGNDSQPSFSPDGSHVIFTRCEATCAIFRVQSDGTGLKAVTHFNHNPDVLDFWAAYSPDGSTIAFTSLTRGGLICAIYLMDADGSDIRQLTPPEITAWGPMWSPDGTKISFATNFVAIHDEEIWVIDVGGRQLTQLTNNNQNWNGYLTGAHDILPSWSTEGDAIAFERDAPDFSASTLYTINADGTGLKAVRTVKGNRSAARRVHDPHNSLSQTIRRYLTIVANTAIEPRWGPEPE